MTGGSHPPRTMTRRRAAFLIGLLLAALLASLEVGARWLLRETRGFDGKHLYQYVFDPYKNILPTPGFVDTRGIRHNSQGFRRSTNVARNKAAHTYRIFLMGGSTAYGIGGLWPHIQRDYAVLDNSQTIDAYLEAELTRLIPEAEFEVINAAIVSTWTHHHLIYLNQAILNYQPDMVLLLDGFNDFFALEEDHDQFASYSYNLPSRIIMGEPTFYSLLYANGWWFFRKSAFAHLMARGARNLKEHLTRKALAPPLDVAKAMPKLQHNFTRNALRMLERIGLLLNAADVRAVFMLQPLLLLERERAGMPPIERTLFEYNVESVRPNYETFMHAAVDYIRAEETRLADRVGAQFMDLTHVFRGVEGQVYTDYAHLTPLGNRVVAEYVAARLAPLIASDLRSPGMAAAQPQE